MIVVVMGVAGSGKSTVGAALAVALGWRFVDGDSYHSESNRAKMRRGLGLDEDDRTPWLAALAAAVEGWLRAGDDVVLACSGLRQSHRQQLGIGSPEVRGVYLRADPVLLGARLAARVNHFAGVALLASQLTALEEPTDAEALRLEAGQPIAQLVAEILAALSLQTGEKS